VITIDEEMLRASTDDHGDAFVAAAELEQQIQAQGEAINRALLEPRPDPDAYEVRLRFYPVIEPRYYGVIHDAECLRVMAPGETHCTCRAAAEVPR
jgi:hypothetical protein